MVFSVSLLNDSVVQYYTVAAAPSRLYCSGWSKTLPLRRRRIYKQYNNYKRAWRQHRHDLTLHGHKIYPPHRTYCSSQQNGHCWRAGGLSVASSLQSVALTELCQHRLGGVPIVVKQARMLTQKYQLLIPREKIAEPNTDFWATRRVSCLWFW